MKPKVKMRSFSARTEVTSETSARKAVQVGTRTLEVVRSHSLISARSERRSVASHVLVWKRGGG